MAAGPIAERNQGKLKCLKYKQYFFFLLFLIKIFIVI